MPNEEIQFLTFLILQIFFVCRSPHVEIGIDVVASVLKQIQQVVPQKHDIEFGRLNFLQIVVVLFEHVGNVEYITHTRLKRTDVGLY
jgi:hypothetical protein